MLWLLLVIVAILLFGAAAVKGWLHGALMFVLGAVLFLALCAVVLRLFGGNGLIYLGGAVFGSPIILAVITHLHEQWRRRPQG